MSKYGEWISCKDKLPRGSDGLSYCETVIAYTVEGEVLAGWLNGDRWYLIPEREDHYEKFPCDYVTHWMPLPEAPEARYGSSAHLRVKKGNSNESS